MLEPASSDFSPFNCVSILYININYSIMQPFLLLEKENTIQKFNSFLAFMVIGNLIENFTSRNFVSFSVLPMQFLIYFNSSLHIKK